jgi:hypothetical protein
MREVDTTCVGRHVVAGAEMAARKSGYRQLHWPFDNDAVVPIGTYGNAVQLVIEAHIEQLSSGTAPHGLIAPAENHDESSVW